MRTGFYRYLQVFVSNFFLMIIVFFAISNIKEWEFAWKTIGLVGLIVAIVGYFVEAPAADCDEYFRLSGITGNANGTANYARVSVSCSLHCFCSSQKMRIRVWQTGAMGSYFISVVYDIINGFKIKFCKPCFYTWWLYGI